MNQVSPRNEFRDQFTRMENEMKMALPVHIPVERFMRVVLTAVNGNGDLLLADRQSLFESCLKAAQDGLLPDGREGALVVYNTNVAKPGEQKRWIKKVQWMPMVAGIMKKARNSGEIALITAGYVVGGDKFRYWIDDDGEHIFYEPGEKQDHDTFVCAFAMAKTKDGVIYAQRVTPNDVEKMRNASKAKDGPAWKNWYDQMAMKGAIRRLAKRLPMSSDLDDLVRRDDELYDFKGERTAPASVFAPVKNPLRDEAPAQVEHDDRPVIDHDEDGVVDQDEGESSDNSRDEQEETSSQASNSASANRGRGAPQAEHTADKVIEADGTVSKDRGEGDGGKVVDKRETAKTEQASTAAPAAAKETAKPADEKPKLVGAEYVTAAKKEIEACTTPAKVTDYWGSHRNERNEALNDEEIDDLTMFKSAHLKKLKDAK